MFLRRAAVLIPALVLFVAAGCSEVSVPSDSGAGFDLGSSEPDLRSDGGSLACVSCAADEVCVDGACVPLPSQCPCVGESYCDLATNMCKKGCLSDEVCGQGRYCETSTRTCLVGCKENQECPLSDVCEDHVCKNNCPSCDDDNPCTTDSCERGECKSADASDGTTCPNANDCTVTSACSQGSCRPTSARADGSQCGSSLFSYCLAGACKLTKVYCNYTHNQQTGYFAASYSVRGGSGSAHVYQNSCGCDAGPPPTLKYYYAGGGGSTSTDWTCATCLQTPGSTSAFGTLLCW